MKMTQPSNTGVTNEKKRKLKISGSNAKSTTLDSTFVTKYLHGKGNNRKKANYVNPGLETEARGHDNVPKKHFDSHNKMKLLKCSKTSGTVKNTATPLVSAKEADFNISESNTERYHGTNGSGVATKKPCIESEKKFANVAIEKNIFLTRIERRAICSNWKLFREALGNNESSTSQVPKFKRKKPFDHEHIAEMKRNIKISDMSTDTQKKAVALENGKQNVRHNQFNGHLSEKEKMFSHKVNQKGGHTENLTNWKLNKTQDNKNVQKQGTSVTVPRNSNRLTKEIALDCEMVGTDDRSDMVARVSLVNKFGECVYDKYVAPTEKVHDYRTWVSGIRPENLKNAEDFKQVQNEVAELLRGRLLVGHALRNDLKVLFLSHPRRYTRDTQRFKLFRELAKSKRPSLKKLAAAVLDVRIQEGEHSSVEDARVAMQLYMMYQKKWEKLFRKSRRRKDPKDITVSSE